MHKLIKNKMKLNIITPEDILYDGEIKSVQLQGTDGKFQILNNHAPIISALSKGQIRITDSEDKEITFDINGGLVEMSKNKIQILAQ